MDDFGPIWLARGVEPKDDRDDFSPIGAFRVSIEQAEIRHEVLFVVGVYPLGQGWAILKGGCGHLGPHTKLNETV